jgi:hypothetical protein
MSTRDIRTSDAYTVCDVCGRTLLRGEKADMYLNGGARRAVCELCKDRALHEGWVREGTVPAYDDSDAGHDRRRSLFGRLRGRRDASQPPSAAPTLADDLDGHSWSESRPDVYDDQAYRESQAERPPERSRSSRRNDSNAARGGRAREPRHVRAVPTSVEQKIASAVQLFNHSEHPRTVAGVARSLGAPVVAVSESDARSSMMRIVVSWELCWYRYEVDLGEDRPAVRVADQGYELDELSPDELVPIAAADERGSLHLGS